MRELDELFDEVLDAYREVQVAALVECRRVSQQNLGRLDKQIYDWKERSYMLSGALFEEAKKGPVNP